MRWTLAFYIVFLGLLGCQSVGSLSPANLASGDGRGGSTTVGGGDDPSNQFNPDPNIYSETPPTISSSPSMGSVMGFFCSEDNHLLCIMKILTMDPEKCPGTKLLVEGVLSSMAMDTDYEKVEINIEYPGGSNTINGYFWYQGSDRIFGKFHTFIDPKPVMGKLFYTVKYTARRTDHPGEVAVVREIELPKSMPPNTYYDGTCNPVLLDVMPVGDPVSDPGF